ncbi:MAG: OmpH family outer membrane protein [Candidatus Obscuribacterales bacterium]|nr:OmpH family outer membrane protein [Steroidobacteraceae bacterium]
MLRSISIATFVVASIACLAPLSAAQAQTKIGVVNFARLADESPLAKALNTSLQEEFGPRQRELVQQQKDLKTKEEKLQRDGAVMADAERNKAQKDIIEGQRDFVRKQNEFKEDLELRRNEELGKLHRSLVQEVDAFAKAQGYDLVISADTVMSRKESFDITAQVVTSMQAKSTKSTPAPKP